jgi:hypothetical protein
MNDFGPDPVAEAADDLADVHDELLDYIDPRFHSLAYDDGARTDQSQSVVAGEHRSAPGRWYACNIAQWDCG